MGIEQMTFSLSPMIIVPLTGLDGQGVIKVKTLFDSGSGSDWIARPLLNLLKFNPRGETRLLVHAFGRSQMQTLQCVDVLIKFDDGRELAIICFVIEEFMVHIVAPGVKEFLIHNNSSDVGDLNLEDIVDPASVDTDHQHISDGIGLVLSDATICKLLRGSPVVLTQWDMILQPTQFGIAVSGLVPSPLRANTTITNAKLIWPHIVEDDFPVAQSDLCPYIDIDLLWKREMLGILKDEPHDNDARAWVEFQKTVVHDARTKRFTVGLPWNSKK